MFFSVMYFLLIRWREKIRNSTPLHVLTISEMAALISLIASFVYLLGFFGIDFVQSVIRPSPDSWTLDDDQNPDQILLNDDKKIPCGLSPATQNDQIVKQKRDGHHKPRSGFHTPQTKRTPDSAASPSPLIFLIHKSIILDLLGLENPREG